MSWKRRWGIVGILVLVQAAVVVCYQGVLTGGAAPAAAQEPPGGFKPDKPTEKKELNEAVAGKTEEPPRDKAGPNASLPAVAVPLPPGQLPKDLSLEPVTPVPTAPPPPPRVEEKLKPVGAQVPDMPTAASPDKKPAD